MRLDRALVARGLVKSRSEALEAIKAGLVSVDGAIARKAAQTISPNCAIDLSGPVRRFVSRGGDKLAHALATFNVRAEGRHALDLGSSTGGFTHVLLEAGAASVTAIDVGRDQFTEELKADCRVTLHEGLDARHLSPEHLCHRPDLVVVDVSFIALAKLLPVPLLLADDPADLIALVKPQFEVGRAHVGKGGIVKDSALQDKALGDVKAFLAGLGWAPKAFCDSPILGGDGNREFLLHARRS